MNIRIDRVVPAAVLLALIIGGGHLALWAGEYVGPIWSFLGYWLFLIVLAVWVLGFGAHTHRSLRRWWARLDR